LENTLNDETILPAEIDIDSLVVHAERGEALKRWNSFIPVRPAETSASARPPGLVNAGDTAGWYNHVHCETAAVREIGVYLLDHVTVSGHSYAFREGRMLADGSEPHRVARSFAADERLPPEQLINRERRLLSDPPVLLIGGPGYLIWGHWLLDFLPRLAIAQEALGTELARYVIPLPNDVPGWVPKLLQFFCGIPPEQLFLYDRERESLFCRRICIPSFVHSNYFLHSFTKEFYHRFMPANKADFPARFCVSRRTFSASTRSTARHFEQESYFEEVAAKHGYVDIEPEKLGFADQIALFAQARSIAGQAGSGMHSALFSPAGTQIGQFAMPNSIQSRIAALCDHRLTYLFPDRDETDPDGIRVMAVAEGAIDRFFEELDQGGGQ
jgi:hypothetical protein